VTMPGSGLTSGFPTGFTYTGLPARVVFGTGTLGALRAEVERLAITRALVLTTPARR
jgi:maleylacetate reductase